MHQLPSPIDETQIHNVFSMKKNMQVFVILIIIIFTTIILIIKAR